MGKTASSQSTEDGVHNPIQNANDGLDSHLSEEIVCVGGQPTQRIHITLLLNKGESMNVHLSFDGPKKTVTEDQLLHISSVLGSHSPLEETNSTELALGDKDVTDSSRSHSTSILEKIFGSSSSTNDGSSSSIELQTMRSPKSVYSSKFAQWFSEEEAKTVQNNFLSFVVGGDKANGISNKTCPSNKEDTAPTVVTCEDLEQSILSEYTDLTSWSTTGGGLAADNHASVHLLSMLQKNSEQTIVAVANKETVPGEHDRATVVDNGNLGKTLTLEALFGSAFMNELQSVEAQLELMCQSLKHFLFQLGTMIFIQKMGFRGQVMIKGAFKPHTACKIERG